jgi:hypothetical protein
MKKIVYIVAILGYCITITSCGSSHSLNKSENELIVYTLKNKQELLEQKILPVKAKIIIVQP